MDHEKPDYQMLRVRDLEADDRPREKALQHGIQALSDAELVALMLNGGIQGLSVLDLAKLMIHDSNGSLATLRRTSIQELIKRYKGVGTAKAVTLAAAFELGARAALEEEVPGDKIRSSRDIFEIMRHLLEAKPHEEFWILLLSRSNVVTEKYCLSKGGTTCSVVDVKLLVKHAVERLAESLVLVHNHPSGAIVPSAQDDALTKKIVQAAQLFDIRVLDHLIIGHGKYYSYCDQGKL